MANPEWVRALAKRTGALARLDGVLQDHPEWRADGVTDRTVELVRSDGKGIWVFSHDPSVVLESINIFDQENPNENE